MNEAQKNKAMERLKKLLALSRSTNEHEAASALCKAQELMRELSISEDDLELTDYAAIEADSYLVRPGYSIPVYVSLLRRLVSKAFGCDAIWDEQPAKYRLTWLGQRSKEEVSAYSWTVLARLIKAKRAYYKFTAMLGVHTPGKREALADIYCEGWVSGVSQNILPESLSDKEQRLLDLFVKQKFPHTTDAKRRGAALTGQDVNAAYSAGQKEGRKTHLHAGVQNIKRGQVGQTQYLGAPA
ncbi:MAG: DUF2786 domain-containing protein [Acetobacter sp.]|uniref:DUF2786 domain-containing protein n=1 Tax=Acetobacter sp. TaxID=440 RepID=UPI003F8E843C